MELHWRIRGQAVVCISEDLAGGEGDAEGGTVEVKKGTDGESGPSERRGRRGKDRLMWRKRGCLTRGKWKDEAERRTEGREMGRERSKSEKEKSNTFPQTGRRQR